MYSEPNFLFFKENLYEEWRECEVLLKKGLEFLHWESEEKEWEEFPLLARFLEEKQDGEK